MGMKAKTQWGLIMTGLIGISYLLFRFVFFNMHGMKEWPMDLAVLCIAIIMIATIFGNRKISIAIGIGYIGGFIIAMIFNTDGVDPGGGRTNNAWILWSGVLLVSLLIGFIASFIPNRIRKN
jgi:hypothetical protein